MTDEFKFQNVPSPYVTLVEQAAASVTTPSAGRQRLFIDSADGHLKRVDESDVVTEIEGGGVTLGQADPYGIHHRLSGSHADDDEFSSDTSANYTELDVSGTTTWAITNHVASCVFTGQTANDLCAYLKAITMADGDWLETCVRIATQDGVNYNMVGLVLTDGALSSSNAIALLAYPVGSSTNMTFSLWTGTLTNMASTPINFTLRSDVIGGGLRLRLKRVTSTSYKIYAAPLDGGQFSDFGTATGNPGFTPTHGGLCVSTWGGSHTVVAGFDYLRHMS